MGLALDRRGKVYAAWYDYRNNPQGSASQIDVFFNRSTNFGNTFEPDRQAGGFYNFAWAVYPSIAADSKNHVYVVWERNVVQGVYLNRSDDGGATFKGEGRIDNTPNAGFPDVACDDSGHVYVSRHDQNNVNNIAKIYVDISNDFGQTFNVHKEVSGSFGGVISSIATDGFGKVYVVFAAPRTYREFYLARSPDYGNTWETPKFLGSLGPSTGFPLNNDDFANHANIAVEGDNVYVAWLEHVANVHPNTPEYDVYILKSSDEGATFDNSPIKLNGSGRVIPLQGSSWAGPAHVAVDGSSVYVAWNTRNTGNASKSQTQLVRSTDGGNTFGAPIRFDDSGNAGATLSDRHAIAAQGGSVYAVWADGRTSTGEARFARADPFLRFVVMADSRGDSLSNQVNQKVFRSILRSVNSLNTPVSLMLFGGDMIYGKSGVESALTQWRDAVVNQEMGANYAQTRILPAFGSHEESSEGAPAPSRFEPFSNVFDPVASFIGGSSRGYMDENTYKHTVYYCDYGNARFFVLNNDSDPNNTTSCTTIGGRTTPCTTPGHEVGFNQRNWITPKLGEKELNFFIHHLPVYGVNAHGLGINDVPATMDAKPTPRTEYLNVIQQNDAATLVFSGHEHQYARMNINESAGLYELKTATCGAPISARYDPNFNKDRRRINPIYAYHYAVVDVDGKQVTCNVRALPSLPPGGLLDNGNAYTVNISSPIQAKSVMFFIDNSTDTRANIENTGLAEITIFDSSNVDITDGATLTPSKTTTGNSSENVRDNNPATFWETEFVRADTWIKLEWATSQSISRITLNDVPLTTPINVKGGTLIIEDANGIPIIGTIVGSTLNVNQSIDPPFTYNYSTHSGVPPLSVDEDQDGILNTAEGSGDVDGDGISDFQDGDTGVTLLASGVGQVAIDVNEDQIPGIALNAVDTILDTDSSLNQQNKPNRSFPYGLICMDIQNVSPGGTVEVTLTFPSNIPMDYQYWKYDTKNVSWYQIPFGSNDGDNTITITLTDRGIGDGDGMADGIIRDPGGLAAPKPEVVNNLVTFIRNTSSYKTITDTTGCILDEEEQANVYVGQFSFDATLSNKSNSTFSLSGLVVEVAELTNENLLQNADGGPGGAGARLTVPNIGDYADGILEAGKSVNVHFVICLTEKKPFRFVVDVLGFKKAGETDSLGTDSLQVAEPHVTNTESERTKFRKGSRITGKRFFGRFRP